MAAVAPAGGGQPPVSVAHLIYGLGLGGLEQLVVQLCVRSRENGIAPSVIAFGPDGPMRDAFEREQIPLRRIDAPGMSLAALRGIRQALASSGGQVIHAHDLGPWLNAVAVRALRPSVEVIATFHEQRVPSGAIRRAAAVAARFSFALVACGKQVQIKIQRWAPAGTRVPLIENGVPLTAPIAERERALARDRMGIPGEAIAIGYIGRLDVIKGPDCLLKGFLDRFGNRRDVHLALVGSGPLERKLRECAAGRSNVHFTGLVPDGARLLAGLDIYAQTSRSEGRSIAMLEAMAAGLPTVASALDPIREIHSDGKTALLVPPSDTGAIAGALSRLCEDVPLRRLLGGAAREAVQQYSIDNTVDAYVALYREIACNARAA